MNEEIRFRHTIHQDSFRFDVSAGLWSALYEFDHDDKTRHVVTVTIDGVIKGYAVYSVFVRGQFRQLSVLDICTDSEKTLAEIVDLLKKRALDEDVDLIYVRKAPDSIDRVFDQKDFISFIESVIMVTLLNPHEFLRALSREINDGKNLKLCLKGFEPFTIRVGKNGIKVLTDGMADLVVSTDSDTFLRLVFCRASFWKEFLKGKIRVSRTTELSTARRFLDAIKQERWHIPFGDWV